MWGEWVLIHMFMQLLQVKPYMWYLKTIKLMFNFGYYYSNTAGRQTSMNYTNLC